MRNNRNKTIRVLTPCAKITSVFALICLCFALTACDPGNFHFKREDLSDVTSIELVYYDNPEQKHFLSWVPDHSDDLKPFDRKKLTVVETLNESKITDFTDTLCEFLILDTYYAYDSPNGLCIQLSYSNGDFLILSSNFGSFAGYVGKFSASGEVSQFIGCFCDCEDFKSLVYNYFDTKINRW